VARVTSKLSLSLSLYIYIYIYIYAFDRKRIAWLRNVSTMRLGNGAKMSGKSFLIAEASVASASVREESDNKSEPHDRGFPPARRRRDAYLYEVGKEQDVGGGRPHVSPRGIPSTTAYHRYPLEHPCWPPLVFLLFVTAPPRIPLLPFSSHYSHPILDQLSLIIGTLHSADPSQVRAPTPDIHCRRVTPPRERGTVVLPLFGEALNTWINTRRGSSHWRLFTAVLYSSE